MQQPRSKQRNQSFYDTRTKPNARERTPTRGNDSYRPVTPNRNTSSPLINRQFGSTEKSVGRRETTPTKSQQGVS
jgi:hypothetical protein